MAAREELNALILKEVKRIQLANDVMPTGSPYIDAATTVLRLLNSRANRDLLRRALGVAGLQRWDEEPHLRQMFLRGEIPEVVTVPQERGDRFMLLTSEAPTKAYEHSILSITCLHSHVHVGQRKLLIAEVQFMTQHASKSKTVVYIGAAGGWHIPALCELFPEHRFLLYDPAPFAKTLLDYMKKNPKRVAVYNELFPPREKDGRAARDLAAATSGSEGFLLISDIRRRDASESHPTNADVYADMTLQSDICREMNPKAAHLKCRLPYLDPEAVPPEPDIDVRIPKGDIYFQAWAPHKSTETRLVIVPPYNDTEMMTLSARWYESALFYHNMVCRYRSYHVAVLAPFDLFLGTIYDTCYDCTFERYTIWLYLTMVPRTPSEYTSFAAVYSLFKKFVGREDERMLRS